MSEEKQSPKRLEKRKRIWRAPLLVAAMAVCLCLLIAPSIGNASLSEASASGRGMPTVPAPALTPAPQPAATPDPTQKPSPTPTPKPYDFAQPVAASEAADMAYFSDAVFIGDSRTDGLRLYSGISGTTFFCYKGITVFDIMDRPDKRVIKIDGKKYTVLEALALRQYAKVYISLGVNELGYHNDKGFEATYTAFLKKVRALQPNAVIYLQNLVPVNPTKCKANKQPYWVSNDQVNAYNKIYARLAVNEQVFLVDVATALSDEAGILPADGTVDGIHFTKAWYKKWLAYLTTHTVKTDAMGLSL